MYEGSLILQVWHYRGRCNAHSRHHLYPPRKWFECHRGRVVLLE